MTRLLGQSPAGLSATGDSDIRNYYDMIAARQEIDLRPQLERLDRLLLASAGAPRTPRRIFEINVGWSDRLAYRSTEDRAMTTTIYVQLLDEGTTTYRPTEGEPLGGNRFKLLPTPRYDPEDEVWEFLPGSTVECDWEIKRDGPILIARRRAEPG